MVWGFHFGKEYKVSYRYGAGSKRKAAKEFKEGGITGPFMFPLLPDLNRTHLGEMPKILKVSFDSPLAFPKGGSVDDLIPIVLCFVKYSLFDSTVRMLRA